MKNNRNLVEKITIKDNVSPKSGKNQSISNAKSSEKNVNQTFDNVGNVHTKDLH